MGEVIEGFDIVHDSLTAMEAVGTASAMDLAEDLVYERVAASAGASLSLVSSAIPVYRLNCEYNYISCSRSPSTLPSLADERNLIVCMPPSTLVRAFRFVTAKELKKICVHHGIRSSSSFKIEHLRGSLMMHNCVPRCGLLYYIFQGRTKARINVEWKFACETIAVDRHKKHVEAQGQGEYREDDGDIFQLEHCDEVDSYDETETGEAGHLDVASEELRLSIIDEWQTTMSTANMRRRGCAVCARLTPESSIVSLNAASVPLYLLRNDDLPEHIRPKEYNMAAYDMAILHFPGLANKTRMGIMFVCETCASSLRGHVMPKLSLANWLYYGYSALTPTVKRAFDEASTFDLMLIARARASSICFRFGSNTSVGSEDSEGGGVGAVHGLRKGIRGNVMVTPLDATRLTDVLPPGSRSISDTVCAVFVGKSMPTRATIAKMSPVLVRKSRVKILIEFLLQYNPHYRRVDGFKGFSAENLNRLFGKDDYDKDDAVPCSMDVGHVQVNDAVDSATSDYTPRNEYEVGGGEILMENVGFTSGDDSPQSYRDMKLKALGHCLSGGSFVSSRRGSKMIPDFDNPYLLSWLFPHLDPWGIGGFHHPKRKRDISMDEQLSHLLQLDGGRFDRDPEFAFVFYNIRQKKLVSHNVRFRVPQARYRQIVKDLLDVNVEQLMALRSTFRDDPMYHPVDDREKALVRLLANVSMVGSNIPGSAAYKVALRNEIRAVINYRGAPTLFITLNPSDVDHPLVRLNAGHDIDLEDIARGEDLDKWGRMLLAAKNPSACALFFHSMINGFVSIILRASTGGRGLFGKCTSYYGSVEANGRGTLHCHMLVWLEGHPSPQLLRSRMESSQDYKEKTFRWLESIIKCELLGTLQEVIETEGPLPRPKRSIETGDPHPGTIPAPSVRSMVSSRQFRLDFEGFVNSLVKEYNWHVHTSSCWKHLGRRQVRDDHNCRMGIDGHTLAKTTIDSETASVLMKRLHPRIASFNDVVIFLLKCNMDIKFIGSGEAAKAYLYYITDYITKPSLPVHVGLAALSYAIKQTSVRFPTFTGKEPEGDFDLHRGAMIITVNSMMGHQEISHQQVMSYLIGGGDHYTPDTFQTLHWGVFKALARYHDESLSTVESGLPEPSVMLQLGKRSITASNQALDYIYRTADREFDSMCLYEFFEMTKKVSLPTASKELLRAGHRESMGKIIGGFLSNEHPQYNSHVLRLRKNPVVPVILGDKILNPERGDGELEEWSKDVMLLFIPWRSIRELKGGCKNWTAAFQEKHWMIQPKYKRVIRNLNVLSECRDARGELSRKWRDERRKDDRRFEVDDALEAMLGQEEEVQRANVFDAFGVPGDDGDAVGACDVVDQLGVRNNALLDFCLPLDVDPSETMHRDNGDVTEVERCDRGGIEAHANSMSDLKRKRRPEHGVSSEGEVRRRRRTSGNDPRTTVGDVDSSFQSGRVGYAMHNVDYSSDWSVVDEVIRDMNMGDNNEQTRALRIMARRVIEGGPQLLMYVAGVGGTGKSHLIKALVSLFERLGRRDELLLGAPTGIAAVLIGGYTMHSLSMTNPHRKSKDTQELVALWRGVKFLVVDEISMVGSLFLSQFSSRLKQAMAEDPVTSSQPFGAVNVVFLGDFGQLKPPRQHSLYAYQLVQNPSFEESRNVDGINAMNGAFLWRQVNVVVKLTRNHRHHQDRDYANLLERIRAGESRPGASRFLNSECTDDLEYLRTRELSHIVDHDPESLRHFRDAPVIVGSREVRDAVNAKYVAFHARRLMQSVHVYHAVDSVKRVKVSGVVRERLWKRNSRETGDSLGRLPLFVGMRVMVTENLALTKGVVNGVEGVVHSIKYTQDETGIRFASVVYLRIDGVDMGIPGVSSGLVPIFPETVTFEYKYRSGEAIKSRTVSRKQLPLLPSYSYTDFKSQGRTLDRAIVDLATARGQGVYVMLSRVKTLGGLAILRWFPSTKIYQRLSEDMRNELVRVDFLDSVTNEAYTAGRL